MGKPLVVFPASRLVAPPVAGLKTPWDATEVLQFTSEANRLQGIRDVEAKLAAIE